jgi:transcriptional regulator with XRE-family HTH domain
MSRIREIRKRLDLTQAEFGAGIRCTQGNVGFYERGEQALPVDRAQTLIEFAAAKGLRLTLDQIYGRKPLPQPKTARA